MPENCAICKEEAGTAGEQTYLPRQYLRRLRNEQPPIQIGYIGAVAHLECITMPSWLDPDGQSKWILWKVTKQEALNGELKSATRRLEDGFCPSRKKWPRNSGTS